MADRIRIQTELLEEIRSRLIDVSSALSRLGVQIRNIDVNRVSGSEVRIPLSFSSFSSIGCRMDGGSTLDCLRGLSYAAQEMGDYTRSVAGGVGVAADAFADTERGLALRFGGLMHAENGLFQNICDVIGFDSDVSHWTPEMQREFLEMQEDGRIVIDGNLALVIGGVVTQLIGPGGIIASFFQNSDSSGDHVTTKLDAPHISLKAEGGISNFGPSGKTSVIDQNKIEEYKEYYDRNGNQTDKTKKKLGERVQFLTAGISTGKTVSAWAEQGCLEGENYTASTQIGIGNIGATSYLNGGFGVYLPGKDGEMQLYLGGKGKIGVSASAIDLNASLEYELCDNVDLSVDGEVGLLSGKAELSAGFGIVGGELMGYAQIGAEANLIELEGKIGVDIGGVQGSVGADVKVGIGATAKAGYQDGVISFEIGASLGIGASINVELDVSNVVEGIGNALNDVGEAVEGIGNAIGEVGNAVGSFVGGICSFCAWW